MEHAWGEDRILTHWETGKKLFLASQDKTLPFPPPRFLSIWLSQVCNLDCTYCFFAESNHDKGKTFAQVRPTLDWLRDVREAGAEALEFSGGGEPTLHPQFYEVLAETFRMGYQLGLITHACNDMLHETLSKALRYIRCGLDAATTGTHDLIKQNKRKNYWFPRAVENIKELVKRRDEREARGRATFTVGIKVVLNAINKHELGAMIELARKLGVDYLQVKYEHSSDSGIDERERKSLQDVLDLEACCAGGSGRTKIMGKLFHQRATVKCFMSPIHTVVTATGEILQCCFFEERPIGTIFQDFGEVWGGEQHRRVMEMTTVNECDKVDCRWHYYNRRMKEIVEDPLASMSFI